MATHDVACFFFLIDFNITQVMSTFSHSWLNQTALAHAVYRNEYATISRANCMAGKLSLQLGNGSERLDREPVPRCMFEKQIFLYISYAYHRCTKYTKKVMQTRQEKKKLYALFQAFNFDFFALGSFLNVSFELHAFENYSVSHDYDRGSSTGSQANSFSVRITPYTTTPLLPVLYRPHRQFSPDDN